MGKSLMVNLSLAPTNILTSWLIGPKSIPLSYIKINVVSALCYCLIKEIHMDSEYRLLLEGLDKKCGPKGGGGDLVVCAFVFFWRVSSCHDLMVLWK